MLVCNGTVWIDSERVVPRQRRAEWLEKHGTPGDKLAFEVAAPARAWTAAGCHLSADGRVKRVSREAVDALCVPARDLVRDQFPRNTIPRFAAERALRIAASRLKRAESDKAQRTRMIEESKVAASSWVAEHCTAQAKLAMTEGADPRKLAVDRVWLDFVRYLGVEPLAINPKSLSARYNPSAISKEIRASLIDTVKEFARPSFVRISVLEVSRLENAPDGRPFATVVPVKFDIMGYDPTTIVWDGEKPI